MTEDQGTTCYALSEDCLAPAHKPIASMDTGYGYINNGQTAPQIYAISNGLAIAIAYLQPNGLTGAFSDLGDDAWEWDEPIMLPTVADCEAALASEIAARDDAWAKALKSVGLI